MSADPPLAPGPDRRAGGHGDCPTAWSRTNGCSTALIAQDPRAAQVNHAPLADGSGALGGPYGLTVISPDIGGAVQEVDAARRIRSSTLSPVVREAAILLVKIPREYAVAGSGEGRSHDRDCGRRRWIGAPATRFGLTADVEAERVLAGRRYIAS